MQISEEGNLRNGLAYKEKLRKKQNEAIARIKEEIEILEDWCKNKGESVDELAVQEIIESFNKGVDFAYYTKEVVGLIYRLFLACRKCVKTGVPLGLMDEDGFWSVDVVCKENGFSKNELENLYALQKTLEKHDTGVLFKDSPSNFSEVYTIKDALVAYNKLNGFADFVKSKRLSTVEKLALCYAFTASRVYSKNDESYGATRDLIAVLNSDDIVCVGYTKIFQNLCSQLGLECKISEVKLENKEKGEVGLHVNCRVYVDDPKYKVKGYFDFDPTFDARTISQVQNNQLNTFTYFMMPIGDYKNNKRRKVSYKDKLIAMQEEGSSYESLICKGEEFFVDHKINKNFCKTMLSFSEIQDMYDELNVSPEEIIKASKSKTLANAERVSSSSGRIVLENFQKYCPNVLRYKLPTKILMKALAYEIVEPQGDPEGVGFGYTNRLLQEAKVDFYKSLNDLIPVFKAKKIRGGKHFLQETQQEIVDSANFLVDYPMIQTKTYTRLIEEVQLLDIADKKFHKTSAGLSLSDYQKVITKVAGLLEMPEGEEIKTMKETVRRALLGYGGLSSLTSKDAKLWFQFARMGEMDALVNKILASKPQTADESEGG